MPRKPSRKLKLHRLYRKRIEIAAATAFMVLFAIIGVHLITNSHAASPYATAEAENGTVTSPASVQSDTNASGGKYVQFSSTTPPGNATYTHAAGFPQENETEGGNGYTQTITTPAVGDIIIVTLHTQYPNTKVNSVSDTAGDIAWQTAATVSGNGNGDTINTDCNHMEIWYGVVTKVGSTTVTGNWANNSDPDGFIYVDAWASSLGTNSNWSAGQSAFFSSYDNGINYAAMPLPSLTTGSKGGMYVGYIYGGSLVTGTATPSGWVAQVTNLGNCLLWSPSGANLSPSTAYAPTCSQSPASWYDAIAAIFQAT